MNEREVRIEQLIGRRVRDAEGCDVGRIEEMVCEIELHGRGRDYVVRAIHVGTFGALDALGGSRVLRLLLRTLLPSRAYRRVDVPWSSIDLSDPERPRLNRMAVEIGRGVADEHRQA